MFHQPELNHNSKDLREKLHYIFVSDQIQWNGDKNFMSIYLEGMIGLSVFAK